MLVIPLQLAFPQTESAPAEAASGQPATTSDVYTLSRRVLRALAAHGMTYSGMFVQDWSRELDSDDSPGGFGRYSFDLTASFDNASLLGWKGSTASVRLKHHIEEFGATDYNLTQLLSNIDAGSRTTLYEVWLQQTLFHDRMRLRFGKIDANTEFAVVQNGGDFLNSSMGFSPTILAFPSYPEPKLGINAAFAGPSGYGVAMGVFETAGNGILTLIEPKRQWRLGARELSGHLNLGYWRLDRDDPRFDGGTSTGSDGVYAVAEQDLWKQDLGGGRERRLAVYMQVGTADRNVSAVSNHLGLGAVLQAPFQKRLSDSVGFAITRAGFSTHPDAGFDYSNEFILETYYRAALLPHVAFVQDLQVARHPSGLRSNSDCFVITPRLVVSF